MPAIPVINILDDLFAAFVLEVHIDIRRFIALLRDKPLHKRRHTPRIYLGDAEAMVKGSTRLRGVETAYDGWPLVGTLVRSIAEERFRGMAPQANRIANREARVQIESEMDAQIETRVDEAAEALTEAGAKSVSAYITHGVLSGGAVSRVSSSPIQSVVTTDSIMGTEAVRVSQNVKQISIAPLMGEAINRISEEKSVSSLFDYSAA